LLLQKNHDYGDSFHVQFEQFGPLSGIIRMSDKVARLTTLLKTEAQVDEAMEDTLRDLAGYALLTLYEIQRGEEHADEDKGTDSAESERTEKGTV